MSGLGLPMAECPEKIGLSAKRLERIRTTRHPAPANIVGHGRRERD